MEYTSRPESRPEMRHTNVDGPERPLQMTARVLVPTLFLPETPPEDVLNELLLPLARQREHVDASRLCRVLTSYHTARGTGPIRLGDLLAAALIAEGIARDEGTQALDAKDLQTLATVRAWLESALREVKATEV